MMKKILVVLITFLGLFLLAHTALQLSLPERKVREALGQAAKERFQRNLQIDGISLGFTQATFRGIKLTPLAQPSLEPELTIDSLTLHWKLWPLIQKQWILKRVELERPLFHRTRDLAPEQALLSFLGLPALAGQGFQWKGWTIYCKAIDFRQGGLKVRSKETGQVLLEVEILAASFFNLQAGQMETKVMLNEIKTEWFVAKDFEWTAKLLNFDPSVTKLSGHLDWRHDAGHLKDAGRFLPKDPLIRMIFLPLHFQEALRRPNATLPWRLNQGSGRVLFESGVAHLSHFVAEGQKLELTARGTSHLVSQTVEVELQVKSDPSGPLGDVQLHLGIRGTLSEPKAYLKTFKKKGFKATVPRISLGLRGPIDYNRSTHLA